jgi:hypothetical protein
MIPFFRKIRKKMADDNKPMKYARYAIGEIALVVIGILIALQINNWNTQQIEIKNLRGDLIYLIQNLQKDKKQLLLLKQERLKVVSYATEFIESFLYSKPITSVDPVKNFIKIIIEVKFVINDNGFERVNSSKIFESKNFSTIRNKMRVYSEAAENIRFQENNQNLFTEVMENELFKNGFFSRLYPYMRANFYKEKFTLPPQKLDFQELIENYDEVKGIFIRYEFAIPIIVGHYDDLLVKGEELKLEIEKYLEQE